MNPKLSGTKPSPAWCRKSLGEPWRSQKSFTNADLQITGKAHRLTEAGSKDADPVRDCGHAARLRDS
jgi:hypothetical protein